MKSRAHALPWGWSVRNTLAGRAGFAAFVLFGDPMGFHCWTCTSTSWSESRIELTVSTRSLRSPLPLPPLPHLRAEPASSQTHGALGSSYKRELTAHAWCPGPHAARESPQPGTLPPPRDTLGLWSMSRLITLALPLPGVTSVTPVTEYAWLFTSFWQVMSSTSAALDTCIGNQVHSGRPP